MKNLVVPILYDNIQDTAELVIDNPVLEFIYKDISIKKEDTRPFFALMEIRRYLESINCFILCNGSRVDIWPSGMSSSGYKAYIHPTDRPLSKTDLVNIFDPTDKIEMIKTVHEQNEFIKLCAKTNHPKQ